MAMIKGGAIGDVLHVRSNWLRQVETDRMASAPGHWSNELKGGRWAEPLPHNVYIAYQLLGKMKVRSVQTKTVSASHPWLRPDELEVVLEHERGYADILLSANVKASNSDIMITGSRGSVICDYGTARALSARVSVKNLISDNAAVGKRVTGPLLRKLSQNTDDPTGHRSIIQGFVNEAMRGSLPLTPWEEAYHTMEIVDEICARIEDYRSNDR
jgi:predicted dehydrogenase